MIRFLDCLRWTLGLAGDFRTRGDGNRSRSSPLIELEETHQALQLASLIAH